MWKTLSDSILALIYPQDCNACNGEVESFGDGVSCSNCWEATKIFDGNETLCIKCGAFLFEGGGSGNLLCRRCTEHRYDRAVSLGNYENALTASVLRLKRIPHTPLRLRRLFIDAFERISSEQYSLVIPVPLSSRRQYERGFNQAAVLGRVISKHARLPLDEKSLVRRKHTLMHRAGMDNKARNLTVKNAFEVVRPKLIDGQSVLLVDDVFTSGETASMCASVLKASGASTVNVLTVARAA